MTARVPCRDFPDSEATPHNSAHLFLRTFLTLFFPVPNAPALGIFFIFSIGESFRPRIPTVLPTSRPARTFGLGDSLAYPPVRGGPASLRRDLSWIRGAPLP